MEKIRFLMIGVGGMGREHIRRLLQVPEAEIVALADPSAAAIEQVKERFHISGPGWLSSKAWAMPAMILISLWQGVAGSTVIYLAGLQDIPRDLYESSDVDGANIFHKARHITLPLLTPVIFFQLIMGIIGAFQQFNLPYLITGGTGNPDNALQFFGMYQYSTAFSYLKMGYASAQAWVMFILILLVTLIIFRSQNNWVFYQGKKDK